MVSTTNQSSNNNKCSSSTSTNSKEHSMMNKEIITKIKTEADTDEVKVFSASTIDAIKSDNDQKDDIDIEDRLSPIVDEPTSPSKTDTLNNNNASGLYTSPFLYPYFHPYFMAATAQMNSSTDKLPMNNPVNNPFSATPSFSGMPFLPLYPPGMIGQPFQTSFFNPFGFPMPTPGVPPTTSSHRQAQPSNSNEPRRSSNTSHAIQRPPKPHIKKPLNAFMIYMKEQRARIIEECTLKESSAINKILGQKWKELSRSEQDRYYELAKEERHRHMQLYPNWSARDNYGLKKKRSTGRIQKSHVPEKNTPQKTLMNNSKQVDNDCLNPKKCRARYGLEGLNLWCKHCRRKKKCTRFLEDDLSNSRTLTNPSSNGNLSSISSPATHQSDDKDSTDELDSDDILSRQIDSIEDEHDDSNEENKQDFYHLSSTLPSHLTSKLLY